MNRTTERGHQHAEAFSLMWYACKSCGSRVRVWNSRDGVTPFSMSCVSCDAGFNGGMVHVHWNLDEYAPGHKPRPYQFFWRDGTPDEAAAIMTARIQQMKDTYPCSPEKAAELIERARNNTLGGEFQKGWPMLDIQLRDEPQP